MSAQGGKGDFPAFAGVQKERFMLFGNKSSAVDWLVAGLGNPGQKYQNTRHNISWRNRRA